MICHIYSNSYLVITCLTVFNRSSPSSDPSRTGALLGMAHDLRTCGATSPHPTASMDLQRSDCACSSSMHIADARVACSQIMQ